MDKEFLDRITSTSGCTLEEYRYVYPRFMNNHITSGVPGRNELQFIRREIENHTIILEGLKKTMLEISDFDYRRKNFDPIEDNFGQEKFLNTMASYGNMRDNHELIIEYLESKKTELENNLVSTTRQQKTGLSDMPESSGSRHDAIVIKEKHGDVFANNGFELFEHILNQYVKTSRGRLSDIHYFYWAMFGHYDKYIHKRPEEFKTWYFKKYSEDLGKIKTFKEVQNPDRDKHFSNALDWFKTLNQ